MAINSMLAGLLQRIGDIIAGFFAIIPQTIYFLYASLASLMDLFQLVFRKLVGLDSYYITVSNGSEIATEQHAGDIIVDLIEGVLGINKRYSALNTVFWSMIIFGFIILVLMTIITFIKAHYNYDSKKSSPGYILTSVIKSIATMVIIPITTVFGLYIGFAVFGALDTITSPTSSLAISTTFEPDAINMLSSSSNDDSSTKVYGSYDLFGVREWSNTETFSGIMFRACASSANRVRSGAFTPNSDGWDNVGIFYTSKTADPAEVVASQIDFAFANNLTLATKHTVQIAGKEEASIAIGSSLAFGPSAAFASGLINVVGFSKFNVGLVWHYYNLWVFNYLIGFGGMIIAMTLFTSIIFGLMLRIILCIVLFLVYPPIVGIMPFDEGKAVKSWREQFMTQIISGYASVIAMNIVFLLLPVINTMKLFSSSVVNGIVDIIITLSALSLVKRFSGIVSKFVGAKDISDMGSQIKQEGSQPAMKGIAATVGTASMALSIKNMPIGPVKAFQKSSYYKHLRQEAIDTTKGKITTIKNSKFGKGISKIGSGINKFVDKGPGKLLVGMLGFSVDPYPASAYREETYEDINDDGEFETVTNVARRGGEDSFGRQQFIKKKSGLKRLKEGLIDLSKVAFKSAAEISGAKNFVDKLGQNTAAVDIFKGRLNDLALYLGRLKDPKMKMKDLKHPFKTKKITDDQEEDEQVNATVPVFNVDPSASKKALADIEAVIRMARN